MKTSTIIILLAINVFKVCNSFMHNHAITLPSSGITIRSKSMYTDATSKNTFIGTSYSRIHGESSLNMIDLPQDFVVGYGQSSFLIAETAEWRQYVVLFVVLGVLLDIVLGSPLANIALGPMKRAAMDESTENGDENSDGSPNKKRAYIKNPRERVDSEAVGAAALQKARYSMELRNYLEENKTEEQKYEDIRKKIDAEAAKFDSRND